MLASILDLSEREEKAQSVTLLHMVGEETPEIYNAFTWNNEEEVLKIAACP